jgi:hypothetical protein
MSTRRIRYWLITCVVAPVLPWRYPLATVVALTVKDPVLVNDVVNVATPLVVVPYPSCVRLLSKFTTVPLGTVTVEVTVAVKVTGVLTGAGLSDDVTVVVEAAV